MAASCLLFLVGPRLRVEGVRRRCRVGRAAAAVICRRMLVGCGMCQACRGPELLCFCWRAFGRKYPRRFCVAAHRLVFHNLRSSFAQDQTTLQNESAPPNDSEQGQSTTRRHKCTVKVKQFVFPYKPDDLSSLRNLKHVFAVRVLFLFHS